MPAEDFAEAHFVTQWGRDQLLEWLSDTERLFRLNPCYDILDWQAHGQGVFRCRIRNLTQNPPVERMHELRVRREPDGYVVEYGQGLKCSTELRIEAGDTGSRLVITDDYSGVPEAERKARASEADRSLVPWASALRRYLESWRRWSGSPAWRWYQEHFWLPMRPGQRRIVSLLWWIGLAEVITIAIALALWRL